MSFGWQVSPAVEGTAAGLLHPIAMQSGRFIRQGMDSGGIASPSSYSLIPDHYSLILIPFC
jgi:hypothetical protein